MSSVKDYLEKDTLYSTTCRCNKEIKWTAKFNMPLQDVEKLVKDKFGWTLFPSRCPACRGKVTTYTD